VRLNRFTRRAGLRAGLAAGLAAPLGREASLAAAATGAAQEQPALGAAGGVAALAVIARGGGSGGHSAPARVLRVAAGAGIAVATRWVWPVASKEPAEVRPQRAWTGLAASDDGAGVAIVVNAGAGNGQAGSTDPAAELRAALPRADVVELDDPARLPDELTRLARSGVTALGVAGGDGSINTAAEIAHDHGLPLVVVPAGTLNHLARDLGVETVAEAVDAVRAGTAIEIDLARIAGRPFLNTASFGSYVEIVDAREALEGRIGKWPALAVAVGRVLRRGRPVEVEIDGGVSRLWAVFVGNCVYQPAGMAPTWRERLDDGRLDVRVADAGHPFSRTRLVLAAITGRLHRSPVLRSWHTTELSVRSLGGPLRLARDGETFDGDDEVEITKDGDRLLVYAPRRVDP
jgi:undecaprenyl-diphosphatase